MLFSSLVWAALMDSPMELLHTCHEFSELRCIVSELGGRGINFGLQYRDSGSMMAESLGCNTPSMNFQLDTK